MVVYDDGFELDGPLTYTDSWLSLVVAEASLQCLNVREVVWWSASTLREMGDQLATRISQVDAAAFLMVVHCVSAEAIFLQVKGISGVKPIIIVEMTPCIRHHNFQRDDLLEVYRVKPDSRPNCVVSVLKLWFSTRVCGERQENFL